MFSFVRLSDGGPARHAGPRSEIAIISDLAGRVLGPDSRSIGPDGQTGRIREAIGKIIPGWEPIDNDSTKQEFHIPGRHLTSPQFPTANRAAKLHVQDLPELSGGAGELRFDDRPQRRAIQYRRVRGLRFYRGQDRRDVILMHPRDLDERGLAPDARVTVRQRSWGAK